MRVLIVGGGIAGLTLGAKLRRQGRDCLLVEKAPEYTDIGYGIGLYPLGSCVLHGLGVYDDYAARSVEMKYYEVADHTGQVLAHADVTTFTGDAGPIYMLPRYALIDVLRGACGDLPIRMNTTVARLEQRDATVTADFSDGSSGTFDLVVLCDGIHSQLRSEVFEPCEVFDTGWTLWTWWGRGELYPEDLVREYWGPGWMFGGYPVPGKRMYCAGVPTAAVGGDHHASEDVVRPVLDARFAEVAGVVPEIRKAFADADKLFAWPMSDIRMKQWSRGRIALCGDSAMAFLPTAGIGASNALRAAAALADELSRADAALVPLALELFHKRCYRIIRGNQSDSRMAARLMFVQSGTLAWGRDQLVKRISPATFLSSIVKAMHEPF